MLRPVLFLLAVVCTGLVAPAAAPARVAEAPATPTRVGIDRDRQVSFSLSGRSLTVTLRPVDGEPNPLETTVFGADVVLVCNGTSPRTRRAAVADRELRWTPGATALTARLSRDVSFKPRWCVLEQADGTDLAVTFKLRLPRPTS